MKQFNRQDLRFLPLSERDSKIDLENMMIDPEHYNGLTSNYKDQDRLKYIARSIVKTRKNKRPVIVFFGAHLVRNGLGLIINDLIDKDIITHLATNGAGSIHDWELAYLGKTTEDVKKYVSIGQFGLWQETGKFLNLAIMMGAKKGLGYGESIGKMIHEDKISITKEFYKDSNLSRKLIDQYIKEGLVKIKHPYKKYSLQEHAFEKDIPFTVHPGFGYDIIYSHPLSDGASIGRVSEKDYLCFVDSVNNLEGGVYLSIGSAIASPMVFEKSLSMSRNIALRQGRNIKDFMIVVNDIQSGWDPDCKKEPSKDDPTYYARMCKSFNRMDARDLYYIEADNRDFLIGLHSAIIEII